MDLFELTCTPHSESSTHQMSITIRESCRKSNFLGIDFAHSFIWGDQVWIFIVQDVTAFFCPTSPEYLTFRPFARWMTQQSIRQLEYDLIITMFNVMTSCLVLELIVKARACTGYWKTGSSFEKVSPWSPDKVRQHGIGQSISINVTFNRLRMNIKRLTGLVIIDR